MSEPAPPAPAEPAVPVTPPGLVTPTVAIVGRPNVGKSTLVNRILGRREAVVEDKPGVTRDRVSYPAEWAGRRFTIVDTGGWEVDVAGMEARVAEQAEVAIALADAVMFVVDATVGPTATSAWAATAFWMPTASGSQPPVSTTVKRRPRHWAS